ncbi:hypothetical protein WL48_18770 [Burkholderia ubonensis]|nr:hypothetical protein WL49_05820 [Burkholderia ubonensis]KWC34418.1 hypothetical protein WL48_18770 [Burkholderia ubonensis]
MGAYQVQRRVAWLFWREVALCGCRKEADGVLRGAALERKAARIKPRLVAEFDERGVELAER